MRCAGPRLDAAGPEDEHDSPVCLPVALAGHVHGDGCVRREPRPVGGVLGSHVGSKPRVKELAAQEGLDGLEARCAAQRRQHAIDEPFEEQVAEA